MSSKLSNSSRPFRIILFAEAVFIFSFAVAALLFFLLNEPQYAGEESCVDPTLRPTAAYDIFNRFLALQPEADAWRRQKAALLLPPVRNACLLRSAGEALNDSRFADATRLLDAVDSRQSYFGAQRDRLRFLLLVETKQYAAAVTHYRTLSAADFPLQLRHLFCLQRLNRTEEAYAAFRSVFARHSLDAVRPYVDKKILPLFLQRLEPTFWKEKFDDLLERNRLAQLKAELPLAGAPQLTALFQAEITYRRKQFDAALKLLDRVKAPEYQGPREKMILKIELRRGNNRDILDRAVRLSGDVVHYREFLSEAAGIALVKKDYDTAKILYEEFLRAAPVNDEIYWKNLWSAAWLHYKTGDKEKARGLFEKGEASPFPTYAAASRYWLGVMTGKPDNSVRNLPFSYYATRHAGATGEDRLDNDYFARLVSGPVSPRFRQYQSELEQLLAYSCFDECVGLLRAYRALPDLTPCERNILGVLESILYLRRGDYYKSYSVFRVNFPQYQAIQLPRFLSRIFFPMRYEETILRYCRERNLDPYFVLALIREETFFRSDAVSPANACGLMQLLPATAQRVGKKINLTVQRRDLFDPETNIRLGTLYLRDLLDQFSGNMSCAAAAYNAGENRVVQWRNDFGAVSDEEFAELIPFTETRNYVKNIWRNYYYYRYYYEKN